MNHGPKLPSEDEFLRTRNSLLSRLKNWDDQEGWRDFFDTYWKFLYCIAIKEGLSDADARDVVQETVVAVAKGLREGGFFRGGDSLETARRGECSLGFEVADRGRFASELDLPSISAGPESADESARPTNDLPFALDRKDTLGDGNGDEHESQKHFIAVGGGEPVLCNPITCREVDHFLN